MWVFHVKTFPLSRAVVGTSKYNMLSSGLDTGDFQQRPAEGTGSPRAEVMDHCEQPDVSLEVHEGSQLTGPVCALFS